MKRATSLLTLLALLFVTTGFTNGDDPIKKADAPTATYTIDKIHSTVQFKVRHLGISTVTGSFGEYDATVMMEGEDLSTLSATATFNVASIDTGVERRDGHLKSDDFFSAETYPEMTFESTGVRNIDGNDFELVGNLTIRDVTKEVVLEGELLGVTPGMQGETRAGIEAEAKINRKEFGLTWDRITEAGSIVVSEDVRIILELQLVQQ